MENISTLRFLTEKAYERVCIFVNYIISKPILRVRICIVVGGLSGCGIEAGLGENFFLDYMFKLRSYKEKTNALTQQLPGMCHNISTDNLEIFLDVFLQ